MTAVPGTLGQTISDGLQKSEPPKRTIKFSLFNMDEQKQVYATQTPMQTLESLEKSVRNTIVGVQNGNEITKLAFDEDPRQPNMWSGIWKRKTNQIPDAVIKRIAIADELVAQITQARSCHVSSFGRELQDRFSTGYKFQPVPGATDEMDEDEKREFFESIREASKLLGTCGHRFGVPKDQHISLASFLYQQARNAVLFGRFATEIIYAEEDGKRVFHRFGPVDAGSVYKAIPQADSQGDKVRQEALTELERLQNKRLEPERVQKHEYAFYQVINDRPVQAFTSEELDVWNVYPVTDWELGGYPLTPLDTVICSVTTHLNIMQMNRLYFQYGRAARGMIVISSEDADQAMIDSIRQAMQANINGVQNSYRVPVFGVGKDDKIAWQPFEQQGGRDMEFQYLSDANARSILAAFQMSPEELPGYQHLARGSNSQTLAESNNEYVLTAARDVGIRPLLAHFQDFLNQRILPLIAPKLVDKVMIKLHGLDANTPEKEATRLQQDSVIHMNMDEVLEAVEKDPIGAAAGGQLPLNPQWLQAVSPFMKVGQIRAVFFDDPAAAKDPQWNYVRDPFWFQQQQMLMQQQQLAMQQQQMAAQQAAGGAPGAPASPKGDNGQKSPQGDNQQGGEEQEQQEPGAELNAGVQELQDHLSKAQKDLSPEQMRIYLKQQKVVDETMAKWRRGARTALAEIMAKARKN